MPEELDVSGLDPDRLGRVKNADGFTLNCGDFNSTRSDVGIEVPCKSTNEMYEKAWQFAKAWVDKHIAEKLAEAKAPQGK